MTSIEQEPLLAPVDLPRRRWFSRSSSANPLHVMLSIGLYVFFGLLLIWPILWIVKTGFTRPSGTPTLDYFVLVFKDPALVHGLINAVLVAVFTTLLTLIISMPLAILSTRYSFPGRGFLNGLLLVPLVLPPFVGAIGMQIVLGRFGPLTQIVGGGAMGIDWIGKYRAVGVVVIEALHLYPVMLLNLQAALANIDPAMEQAAANMGAGRGRIFRRITMPMIRPGLFAGCTLVLIWSFTELGTPLMFNFYTITPVQVFEQINEVASNPLPYALVVVMLLASAALYLVGKVLLGRGFDAATTKASVAAAPHRLRGWQAAAAMLAFGIVFLLAVLPHISVVLVSVSATGAWYKSFLPAHFTFDHYRQALVDPLAVPSVWRSLQYASGATVLALIVGYAAAVVVVRSNIRNRWLIDALAMLPLAVPGLVLSFGYLSISIWIKGKWGSHTPFFLDVQEWPAVILVLAYAARRLPYVVRAAAAGLQQTPRDLELAAANIGASRVVVLRRITIPLILANLIAGALLAFAFAMLEVSDSLILAQRIQYYPITKAILDLSQRLGDGLYIASALGVWAMVLLTLTILAANALLGKKLGAVFRL
ncbi:MAG TPA: iron ABC transporter permease [Tepidisphaeraceae bacterium]|nr:iron ABC transporter permease [Tepidisphaeraceae bacterium]